MANDPNWEPEGVTHQVRFCEGGGTYRQGFPPLLSTFAQGTRHGERHDPKECVTPKNARRAIVLSLLLARADAQSPRSFRDRLKSLHFIGPMASGEVAPYKRESLTAAVR